MAGLLDDKPQGLLDRIPYYPSAGYLERNWAPETFDARSLNALANAQRIAEQKRLLSPNLAAKMLPNALVEGWEQFGVVNGRFGYPANPRRDKMMQDLGLRMANSDDPNVLKNWVDIIRDTKEGYWIPTYQAMTGNRDLYAKMATAVLSEKARLYGDDKAIERWNGRGTAMEDTGDDMVLANAKNHASKVREMIRMLQHPKNARIREAYNAALQGAR